MMIHSKKRRPQT